MSDVPSEPRRPAREPPTVPGRRPAEDPSPDDPGIPPPLPSQPVPEPPTVPGSYPVEDPAQNPDVVIDRPGPFATPPFPAHCRRATRVCSRNTFRRQTSRGTNANGRLAVTMSKSDTTRRERGSPLRRYAKDIRPKPPSGRCRGFRACCRISSRSHRRTRKGPYSRGSSPPGTRGRASRHERPGRRKWNRKARLNV